MNCFGCDEIATVGSNHICLHTDPPTVICRDGKPTGDHGCLDAQKQPADAANIDEPVEG